MAKGKQEYNYPVNFKDNNIGIEEEDGMLILRIDLSKDFGKSSSGKNTIIASSRGNQLISTSKGDVKLGLNCFKK